jgi:hypothetical protein
MHINSIPYSGETTVYYSSIGSLSTFFGTFSNVDILGYSDFTLTHPTEGFITYSNWINYHDEHGNTIKAERIQTNNYTNYLETPISTMSEYGYYQVIEDSETIREKKYTQRYYIDGDLLEVNDCRYNRNFLNTEVVTSLSGMEFDCNHYETSVYSNNSLSSYTLMWWNDEYDALVKLERYKSNNTLIMTMILSNFSDYALYSIIGFIFSLGIIGLPILLLYMFVRNKKKKTILSRSGYMKCSRCGVSLEYMGKYCFYCGNELE